MAFHDLSMDLSTSRLVSKKRNYTPQLTIHMLLFQGSKRHTTP